MIRGGGREGGERVLPRLAGGGGQHASVGG